MSSSNLSQIDLDIQQSCKPLKKKLIGLFGGKCGNSMFKHNMFVSLFDCVVQPTPAVAATNSTHVGEVEGTYPEYVQGMC